MVAAIDKSVYNAKTAKQFKDIAPPPWFGEGSGVRICNEAFAGDPVLNTCQMLPEGVGKRPRPRITDRAIAPRFDKEGKITNQSELIQNLLTTRGDLLDWMLEPGGRNLYYECGYPLAITPQAYRQLYDREGHAARVVDVYPEECWAMSPDISETANVNEETDFEKAVKKLADARNLWHYCERIDRLSGIGAFGILLLGIDDGKDLNEPVDGIDDNTGLPTWFDADTGEVTDDAPGNKLLYLRALDETLVWVGRWCQDKGSPRFGQPEVYIVRFLDYTTVPLGQTVTDVTTHMVHWSRVIHIADNRKGSEVFGVPRMQHVFNRLLDVRKIAASSGEMFYKGGFPGYSFEVLPELADAQIDPTQMRVEFERYSAGLQRYLALAGVTAKSLAPQVSDPSKHLESQLQLIALAIGVPLRVFMGSEQAQLASGQDKKTWNTRVRRRQNNYLTPWVVRPLLDRLIALGALPKPKSPYAVLWPDADSPSDEDRAKVALHKTQALSQYAMSGAEALCPLLEFYVKFLNFSLEDATAMVAARDAQETTLQDQQDQIAIDAAETLRLQQQQKANGKPTNGKPAPNGKMPGKGPRPAPGKPRKGEPPGKAGRALVAATASGRDRGAGLPLGGGQ